MDIAKLTSKGQITIPKAVRVELGVDTGDKLVFIKCSEGYLVTNGENVNVNVPAEQIIESAGYSVAPRAEYEEPVRSYVPVYESQEEKPSKPKKDKDKDKDKEKGKDKDKDKDKDKKKKKKKKK